MASLAEQLLLRAAVTGTSPPPDQVVREKCPLLWGLLTQDFYRDGVLRSAAGELGHRAGQVAGR